MCLVAFSKTSQYSALRKITAHDGNPKWAYVVICDDCSHKCSWCYGGFNHQQSNQMLLDNYYLVLKKCKQLGIRQITIAGGEPTEHPQFLDFVRLAYEDNFIIHIATHGEHITKSLVEDMKKYHVAQVQFNFQGQRDHDRVHGVEGSYRKQISGINNCLNAGIEVTTTVTVGKYNLDRIGEIFKQAADLGVNRLRVWETTGLGNSFRKELTAKEIFEECAKQAAELGYTHILSYDPVFEGEVNVPCLQFSGLFMYINASCDVVFCGAVQPEIHIANMLTDNSAEILRKYHETNKRILGERATYCVARNNTVCAINLI